MQTNNHSIVYKNEFYGLILLFFNEIDVEYALIKKMKTFDFKFASPDQNNQIQQKIKNHFEITNKFFKLCELLDEYEVITINDITCKTLLFEMNYKKKNIFCATCMVTDHN